MTIEQIKRKLKRDYKRHKSLEEVSMNEEYKLIN